MMFMLIIIGLLPTCLCLSKNAEPFPLRVGAFNVKTFGVSKMEDPFVVETLVNIIMQYDIMLIQEIRDQSETAFPKLVDDINAASKYTYEWVLGPREGRSDSYKEQYGFMYRSENVQIVDAWLYEDDGNIFEREPYVVTFERTTTAGILRKFSYIPLHAKPDDAVSELNAMPYVYDVSVPLDGEDSLLMGDFNADCSYVNENDLENMNFYTNQTFTWLINNDADTTVSSYTDCAYDRVVVAGKLATENAFNPSVYYFDQEFGYDYYQTAETSDHYPVEVYLY